MTDKVLERLGFAVDIEAGQVPCLSMRELFWILLSDHIRKLAGANAIH